MVTALHAVHSTNCRCILPRGNPTHLPVSFSLTIKGLVKHHSICPIEFTNFIENGLKYEERIQQDSELGHLLTRLKFKKWIFTNANINNTLKTLSLLGVLHLFDRMTSLDLEDPHLRCKLTPRSLTKRCKRQK